MWLRGRVAWHPATFGAGLVYAATLSLFVAATKLTTAANAIFLQSAAPLYVLLLAPYVLHERARRRDLIYLAALAQGLVLCFLGESGATSTASNPVLGNWLGAASGLAWALTLLALRHIGRDDRTGNATVGGVVAGNALAALLALPFALPMPAASVVEWTTLVYLGVFQIGLAYICLTKAIRGLPALEVSLLLLLEPVLNPLWTWAIRGETPGGWTLAGGAVIIGATALKAVVDARGGEVPV